MSARIRKNLREEAWKAFQEPLEKFHKENIMEFLEKCAGMFGWIYTEFYRNACLKYVFDLGALFCFLVV